MSEATDQQRLAEDLRLMRGTGPGLGPLARRFDFEERTLLHVLRAQVRERPDKDWLVFDGRDRLTFAGAQEAAYRFASALRRSELEAATVGVWLRNQSEFMPAFLGAQAAGGIAVPLNPELRGPLLQTMLTRCRARVVVTSADLVGRLAELDGLAEVQLVVVAGEEDSDVRLDAPTVGYAEWIAGGSPDPPEELPHSTQTGALVFTSGTSGGSKAAICSHHYLYLFPACVSDSFGHSADDVFTTPLQMCHVAALQVIANSALQVGATAHMKSQFSVQSYWPDAAADGATFTMLMGQMTAMLVKEVAATPEHRLGLTYVIPEPAPEVHEEYARRYGTKVVWQGWGMSEIFPHLPQRELHDGSVSGLIGPAADWVEWGVVDEHDRLLAPGQLGQLVYRPLIPKAMTDGYYGDPEATVAGFRNFMFHTGDLGFYDEHRNMHFVMRNADAIRRRGENISAVELETVALRHPGVDEAAAYAVPAEFGEHEAKLDVVGDPSLSLDELHAWLQDNLPRFMVPAYLERRDELPKTPSQRVEKYKLRHQPLDRPEVRQFSARRREGT